MDRSGKLVAGRALPALRRQGRATQLIVDGKPLVMIGGELHNSSSSSLRYMEPIWPRLRALHCNTVLAAVSWELVEPEEGRFELELVTGLVEAARSHGLKLVPLWFGTLKNSFSQYAPAWVKTDVRRFPRAKAQQGFRRGANSVFSAETLACDARAFARVMKHIREIDAEHQTVVMVQVENEVGILEQTRDYCAEAEAAFAKPVPAELMRYLRGHLEGLRGELCGAWEAAGSREAGTWTEVFGATGDEVFMAWHMGKFVDAVAAAGAKEYALPLFANAWLTGTPPGKAGVYPSGGPVSRMMDVWKAAAPHLFTLAPDNYDEEPFADACADYAREDNPLLIPEARRDHHAPACVWYALAEHDAMCFAPFGIDSVGLDDPAIVNIVQEGIAGQNATGNSRLLTQSFRVLNDMMPTIAKHHGSGNMIGVLQREGQRSVTRTLGGYVLTIEFNEERKPGVTPAAGLVIATGKDEFLVAGHGFRVRFAVDGKAGYWVENLAIEECVFVDGQLTSVRRLNGDEGGVRLRTREVEVCCAKLHPLAV